MPPPAPWRRLGSRRRFESRLVCALGVTPGSQNDADAMGVWMGGSSGERLNHEKSEVGEKSILPPSWTFSVSFTPSIFGGGEARERHHAWRGGCGESYG